MDDKWSACETEITAIQGRTPVPPQRYEDGDEAWVNPSKSRTQCQVRRMNLPVMWRFVA